ncbi:MAG: tetratricopeptide repeat protein [Myxococcota bacterium]|nr:tetratricopeptide repeat protein [Myxococcota bacterium]
MSVEENIYSRANQLREELPLLQGHDRAGVLAELGQLYAGPLEKPQEALTVLSELFELQPTGELCEQLEELAARTEQFSRLIGVLENGVNRIENRQERIQALHTLAMLYDGIKNHPFAAVQTYQFILSLAPEDKRASRAIDRLQEQLTDSEQPPSDDVVGVPSWLKSLEDAVAASEQEALEPSAGDLTSTEEAREEIETKEDAALTTAPEQDADVAVSETSESMLEDAAVDGESELGNLASEELKNKGGAPLIAANMDEEAAAQKEKLSAESPEGSALTYARQHLPTPSDDLASLRELATHLHEEGPSAGLVNVLGKLIELGPNNPARFEDQVKRAEALVALGRVGEALEDYRAVLLKKRNHSEAIEGLEGLIEQLEHKSDVAQILEPIYTVNQDWEQLAWVLKQRLQSTNELDQRKGLLRRIGDIFEKRLDRKDRAFEMARISLREDPADMGVRMWIEKLASDSGDLRSLADAYVEEATGANPQLALQFLRRSATIYYDKLADTAAAVRVYRAILELDPRDEKALGGLEGIFRDGESFIDLIDVLKHRFSLASSQQRKRQYLNEIAELQTMELHQYSEAVDTLRALLGLTPDDPIVFGEVERLLKELGDWETLADFFEGEIRRLTERRGRDIVMRRLDLMFRKACLLEEELDDLPAATDLFDAILSENPEHTQTLHYLEKRAATGSVEAIGVLEEVYRAKGAWRKYVKLLDSKLNLTSDGHKRHAIYLALADTYAQELRVGDMAFLCLTRAYSENRAELTLLDRMEILAEEYDLWEELIEIIDTDIEELGDLRLRQSLYERLGALTNEHLGEAERALGYYHQVLRYAPDNVAALDAIDSILESNQKWASLAEFLDRRIENERDADKRVELLLRLGHMQAEHLGDRVSAIACYQRILDVDERNPVALRAMEEFYTEVADWESLRDNLDMQREVFTGPEDQVRIHCELARLFSEELSNNRMAIEHWLNVLALEPTRKDCREALEILLRAEERWEDLAQHYKGQLESGDDVEGGTQEVRSRLGEILGDKLGRSEEALRSWLEVLETEPGNVRALNAVLEIYRTRRMWEPFVDTAYRMLPILNDADQNLMRFDLLTVFFEHLRRRDDALALAQELRENPHLLNSQRKELVVHFRKLKSFRDMAETLEAVADEETETGEKVGSLLDAARLYREELDDGAKALSAYECILQTEPANPDAYEALVGIYRSKHEWRKLLSLHESFMPYANVTARSALLTSIRDIYDQELGEKELAFLAAGRVVRDNPVDTDALEILERLADETGGHEEYVHVLRDEVEMLPDPEFRLSLYWRMVHCYLTHLLDRTSAEVILRRILDIDVRNMEAMDHLIDLYGQTERFDKQISVLEARLMHLDDDHKRKETLFEISNIWHQNLNHVDESIKALTRIVELDRHEKQAYDSMVNIYTKAARWHDVSRTYVRQLELTTDPKYAAELRLHLGRLCEDQLEDRGTALDWYRGILEIDPVHVDALDALERLYNQTSRWGELLEILELRLKHGEESDVKVSLLEQMAEVFAYRLDSIGEAVECYERALTFDAKHLSIIEKLEGLLADMGAWQRLVEVLEHHVELIGDSDKAIEIYLRAASIVEEELSDYLAAKKYYSRVRELDSTNVIALHGLGELFERTGEWRKAIEMLELEAAILKENPKAVPLWVRIGEIQNDVVMDRESARQAYSKALAIDPHCPQALKALREVARSSEQWDVYGTYLLTELETAQPSDDKVELFYEAGRYYQDVRDDEALSVRYYQQALGLDEHHLRSVDALADIYYRSQRWEDAEELYRKVITGLDAGKQRQLFCQKCYRLGTIYEHLNRADEALDYYRRSFDADSTYLPSGEGLSQALLAAGLWAEAEKVFQAILRYHRDSLTDAEAVDIYWQLGDLCLKQQQSDRAYSQFEKALTIDPRHTHSLRCLSDLDKNLENYETALERLSRLADALPENTRVEVLLEMADLARFKLRDIGRAINILLPIRHMKNPSLEHLQHIAQLYIESGDTLRAAEVFDQAIQVASGQENLAELNYRLGYLYETVLRNPRLAVQKYNQSLEHIPANDKAFTAVERILREQKDWEALEYNYRIMIVRSKDLSVGRRVELWRKLAELYHHYLEQPENGVMAYEVIESLEPGRPDDYAMLTELYAQNPDTRDKAIGRLHAVLLKQEKPLGIIRQLLDLYEKSEDWDAVFVLSEIIGFSEGLDEPQRQRFERLLTALPERPQESMRETEWKILLHPDVENPVGTLFATLCRLAPDSLTVPAKRLGLKSREQIDLERDSSPVAELITYARYVFNLPSVGLYEKRGSMETLRLCQSQPPALVVGEHNELLRQADEPAVRFQIGRVLAGARPELFLPSVYGVDELRHILFGLCAVYNPQVEIDADPEDVENWQRIFRSLPTKILQQLQPCALEAYRSVRDGGGMGQYCAGVEHTLVRSGFVLGGDLATAARGIQVGLPEGPAFPSKQFVDALIKFAASKEYLRLRKSLGLEVKDMGRETSVA